MSYGVIDPISIDEQQGQESSRCRIYLVTDALKSSHTKRAYRQAFDHFIKTTVKSDDLRALLDTKQDIIESKIIDHITHLKDIQHLSYLSIEMHLSGILHFFEINDINLDTRKIRRFLPEDVSDHYATDRPYSVKEIEQILSKCDVRSRAMVLLMASTGMRIGGLQDLRYEDIKKIEEHGLYMIWVYNRFRQHRYYTFCTPECANALDAYLEYRQKFGEKLEDKVPLIREQFNIDNPFTGQAPKFISQRMMSFIFEDVLKRFGVNQVKAGNDKRDVMSSHGFRKFFITQCVRANINHSTWKCLVGHKLPKPDDSYVLTTEEDRLAEYVRAIPLLTINQNQKLQQENHDLKVTQAQEIDRLKTQIDTLKENNHSEVLTLKAQFDEINERLNRIDLVDLQSFPLKNFPSDYTIHNLLEEYGIDDDKRRQQQQKRQDLMKKNKKND